MNLITNHFEEMNNNNDDLVDDNDWGWYVDLENTKKSNNYVNKNYIDTDINININTNSDEKSNVKINGCDKKNIIRGLQYMNIVCSTTIFIVWIYCFT